MHPHQRRRKIKYQISVRHIQNFHTKIPILCDVLSNYVMVREKRLIDQMNLSLLL